MSKILLIDDDDSVRTLLKEVLLDQDPDHVILMATDGLEGVNLAKQELPDAIISDVDMPNMNGYDVCKHLRSDPRTMKIPIMMLTGKDDLEGALEVMNYGADDHITKPFDVCEVAARLQILIRRGR
jgi:DNA-binding response OmpR family regulator